jgi:hypothetical protein
VPFAAGLLLTLLVLASIAGLAWAVRILVRRLGQLGADLDRLRLEVDPALRQLEADAAVTTTELAAIGDRLEARARAAAARPRRRWRPGPS